VLGFDIYRVGKLKKVILLQGREHKAAGLHWVLGLGCWILGCEPQEPNKPQEPNELKRLPGCQSYRNLWLARLVYFEGE